MATQFELKRMSDKERITGYVWPVDQPHHVVVLIHGIGEHDGRYNRVAQAFNQAGIAMVGMDLRGHGLSMGPQGHCAPRKAVLEDIDELIEYAQIRYPGVPVVLYGHSMGGNIALDYRCRGKYNNILAGYLISAPWLWLVENFSKAAVGLIRVLSAVKPRFTVSSEVKESDLGYLKNVQPYKDDPLVHSRISAQTALEGFVIGKELAAGTHENNQGAKGIPTLLMHGSSDKICAVEGSRQLAQLEPEDITYVEWEGYFHEIHNGGPEATGDQVIERMVAFIQRL